MAPLHDLDEIAGLCQIEAARLLAETIAATFEAAESAGRPATEKAKVATIEAALLSFDGYRQKMLDMLAIDEKIRDAVNTANARVRLLTPDDPPGAPV